ncbi:MBL fold metallo-hydrolase [Pseudogracilibacillus auburnensis]|uniref:Glyoxylase-like metal-dependent hydrolase (Beta-lactamase superfamily II) n=1 Tax=Pseudogracilibacillus auburnensis TaxID=1494959 RepID=A0A2V3WA58_9BACI|nr:MBL fold metallo-hydrolase [Pseudogracilibacillus auburnensis]PXW90426.1 glyoxylase-like metal-dependent hydrolase (beta-lactamase superfamily II) [Pseudogracilibacillus auburnensis]
MKIHQISDHIWSLKIWMLIPIHVWVVVEENGVTLVDAGLPTMAKGILKFIEQLNAGPLKRIVLTHGHSDHTGAIKRILKVKTVPVFAHRIEIPYMEGDYPYPRRKKAIPSIAKGLAHAFLEDENKNLEPVGSLTPYFAPGHSPGHVVFYHHDDRVLLAGDLFTSKKGKLHKPISMFTADMNQAVKSSRIVSQLKPERLEVCHGKSVFLPADQLDEYIDKT